MVWIESPIAKVEGKIELRKGIRPDVVIAPASFGQWATPFAKDIKIPNLNPLAPVHIALTDATGSGSDLVKVKVYKK
jgi:phenylacetyl-CoA:acceptor oxidoreductase